MDKVEAKYMFDEHSHPWFRYNLRSNSVAEMWVILQYNLTAIGASILSFKDERVDAHSHDDDQIASNARPDTRSVARAVLVAEDGAAGNTTDATEPDQGGGGKRSLPLTSNVVRLVSHNSRHTTVTSRADEKSAKVANARAAMPSLWEKFTSVSMKHRLNPTKKNRKETYKEWEADDAESSGEEQQRPSHVPFIANPGAEEHDYRCPGVWRGSQHLGLANGEAHVLTENDGQEIGKRICLGGEATSRSDESANVHTHRLVHV